MMRTFVLTFADSHDLNEVRNEVRAAVGDVSDVTVEREWEQPDDPGEYVALRAPHPNLLRSALADTELEVEGIAELISAEDRDPLPPVFVVHRPDAINNVFKYVNYEAPPLEWCDRCTTAHARGRHVR